MNQPKKGDVVRCRITHRATCYASDREGGIVMPFVETGDVGIVQVGWPHVTGRWCAWVVLLRSGRTAHIDAKDSEIFWEIINDTTEQTNTR